MNLELYAILSRLDVSLAQCLIGLLLRLVLCRLLCVCLICLEHAGYDESDETEEEESDKLGYIPGSFGTCGTGLCMLVGGVKFSVYVTFTGNVGSFAGAGGGW